METRSFKLHYTQNRYERKFWATYMECQRITGHSLKDVLGIPRDSPIYYQVMCAFRMKYTSLGFSCRAPLQLSNCGTLQVVCRKFKGLHQCPTNDSRMLVNH